ncbi:hypothetical protein Tco_1407129 [Tanacetum coccineum]
MGRDREKKKVSASTTSTTSGNGDALARLMVNDYVDLTKSDNERESRTLSIYRDQKEGGGTKGTRDQNARVEQHRQDLQPTDELSVRVLKTTLDLKRAIKELLEANLKLFEFIRACDGRIRMCRDRHQVAFCMHLAKQCMMCQMVVSNMLAMVKVCRLELPLTMQTYLHMLMHDTDYGRFVALAKQDLTSVVGNLLEVNL